jgi:hypothetical protein
MRLAVGPVPAVVLAAFCGCGPADAPDITKVTPEQKKAFLQLMAKLPSRGEFYTDEGVQMASPFLHVLLSLNEKDITADQYFAILALSRGLHDSKKEHQEFAVKQFDKIPHPVIKTSWAITLFRFSREATPAITRYLRESLDDEQRTQLIRELLGPEFEAVRKEIVAKAQSNK